MKNVKIYFDKLKSLFDEIIVTNVDVQKLDFYKAIEMTIALIKRQCKSGNKVMIIGNGASASISSHISTDLWKNAGVKAIAFNDASVLTCISNDYGYRHVFEKPIEMFANTGDILFAISSSGKSANIIKGTNMAKLKGCNIVTFSGFKKDNPLRMLGEINYYVPIAEYGPVEVIHHAICHCIVEMIINNKGKKDNE